MYRIAKRTLDLVVAGGGLVLLAPLFAWLSLAVKCSSPGPVFFRQQRVGYGGRLFWLYKFRTMRPDPGGPQVTVAGDARVTSVGRVMRAWKLDELPQLVNVLRGDMSLVGPRPEVPRYVRYDLPEQWEILSVRPGITGPSQVRYWDEERLLALATDVEEYYLTVLSPAKLSWDLEYVRHPKLSHDLALLFGTLAVLWRTKGSSRLQAPSSK
jgi:lipopolysaccharide/colanic/teichoic acid biosynthesis glycosyltransferase